MRTILTNLTKKGTLKEGNSSTVFILTSPYFLTRHPEMVTAIIDANKRKFLSAIGD